MKKKATPDDRWTVHLSVLESSFNLYFEAQEALGHSREEAVERLRRSWAREDAARMKALAEGAALAARAR